MRELDFESCLLADESIKSKVNAVRSRINKARMIERHFEQSLDKIVNSDDVIYETLLRIKAEMKDTNGNISNSLRKYYTFANNKCFPTLSENKNKGGATNEFLRCKYKT